MNRILFLIPLFFVTAATAQNGFFLQPAVGIGITNTTSKIAYENLDMIWTKPLANVVTINPSLSLGYQHKNWVVEIGVSYLETGYKEHYKYAEFTSIEVINTELYTHYLVPVTVSYQFGLGHNFYVNPGIGIAVSYNASVRETGQQNDLSNNINKYDYTLSATTFDFNFNRTSLWAIAHATLAYDLNGRWSITAGPEIQYTLTDLAKSGSPAADQHPALKNYALTGNAGVIWRFKNPGQRRGVRRR